MSGAATRSSAALSGLVASRLCHDLVSPLGAIGNGLELLELAGEWPGLAHAPEMGLVADSVAAARARIRVSRVAFGSAGAGQRLSVAELASLAGDLADGSRLSVRIEAEGDLPRTEARLILLALMCLQDALPWGGQVLVLRGPAGWRLVASAERLRVVPAHWAMLEAAMPDAEIQPAQVHYALLHAHAADLGRPLTAEHDEKGAEIAF